MKKPPKYILIMKIGPFCGFSLEEIIDIKTKEQESIGKFFLGYSGVFCHPKRVSEFIQLAKNEKEKVVVLFTTTPSNFNSPIEKLSHYSLDTETWKKLPKGVLLVGSKFSIVAKNMKPVNFEVDLSHYQSMLGTVPGKTLDDYLRYRCDKACAQYSPKSQSGKLAKIAYMCELTDEGCVYVR
jgi:ribosomal protein L30E